MPTEVLKPGIAVQKPAQPMTMRQLADLGAEGTVTLGCPMLTRTKVALPSSGGMRAPRCNLAWSIRTEEEVSFCLRTPTIAQCWRAHPERLVELLGTAETESSDEATATAAD